MSQTEMWVTRQARPEDWRHLETIETAVFGEESYSPYFLRMASIIAGPTLLVAEQSDTIGAYALGVMDQNEYGVGWILSLATLPIYRGQGLGSSLCRELETRLIGLGALCLRLSVSPDNVAAQNLYRRLGFDVDSFDSQFFGSNAPRQLWLKILQPRGELVS